MRYIDLFAGIGGFRYGLSRITRPITFENVYSNEWNTHANAVYKKHYGECDQRDIRTVEALEIPPFDLLCAGFPCQSFSIAGNRLGFEDTRGTLFFEIARIIGARQPRFLFLENVKGLLSHQHGITFITILATLDELGYDCQWQVLNSEDFETFQNRERVFIIGHHRSEPRPKVFPLAVTAPTHRLPDNAIKWSKSDRTERERKNYGKTELRIKRGAFGTLTAGDGCGSQSGQNFIDQDGKLRKLTPIECERLQGFPDDWTKYGINEKLMSDKQRYKMIGNAVTTNVITEIMTALAISGI